MASPSAFTSPSASSAAPAWTSTFTLPTLTLAEFSMIFASILAYWVFSTFFYVLSKLNLTTVEMHKIPTDQKGRPKNRVTVNQVLRTVAVQHVVQAIVAWVLAVLTRPPEGVREEWVEKWIFPGNDGRAYPITFGGAGASGSLSGAWDRVWQYGWREWVHGDWLELAPGWEGMIILLVKTGLAMFLLDSYQYWLHRAMHTSRFLYRHIHSTHHALTHPFAFGALYNHPLEGFLLDTLGGGIPALILDMHPWTATLFFTFATLKTVDDHCGYAVPWDPFQKLFKNNAEYHDIHHWGKGIRYNFSQPFFIHWDVWMGTDYSLAMAKLAKTKQQQQQQQQQAAQKASEEDQPSPKLSSSSSSSEEEDSPPNRSTAAAHTNGLSKPQVRRVDSARVLTE
ncbi:hypothetical protein HDV00_006302 [Rhizophlyctis rosea]|nr:hypothetical protein HDV00_006302 [Rhizophlyctis rosea]